MAAEFDIRPAEPADIEVIFELVRELAGYERAADEVTGDPTMLGEALFGPAPAAEALLAGSGTETAGFVLIYRTFSTWECRPGIWIEDLYVRPEHRGTGVGGRLFDAVAELARRRGCGRVEWAALDWNKSAQEFYERRGARRLGEWLMYRLSTPVLERGVMAE